MRSRNTTLGIGLAAVVLAGAGGLVLDATARGPHARKAATYSPPPETPRLAGEALYLPQVHAALDFDVAGELLFLLDPLTPAVHRVALDAGGTRYLGAFGRRGGGPGEFANPTGLAVLAEPPRLAVIEPGRIHTFTLEGEYIASVAPVLPCAMARPRLGGGRHGLFVHDDCLRRGLGGADTMMAVLAWSADGERFERIASEARYTLDGSYGNPFGASVAFAAGSAGRHVFGTGASPCISEVVEGTAVPEVTRECSDTTRPYRLHLSRATLEELEQMRRRSPVLERTIRIPEVHPYYTQALLLGGAPALLRGYAEDSTVLRRFDSAEDLAVLPISGMVGCRRGMCLGVEDQTTGLRLRMYRLDTLTAPVNGAQAIR